MPYCKGRKVLHSKVDCWYVVLKVAIPKFNGVEKIFRNECHVNHNSTGPGGCSKFGEDNPGLIRI